jgi:hypothetical protein
MRHDPIVEHWVWPGLREHILFNPFKYATNRFTESFRKSLHFMWPFEPDDTYNRNTTTGMYSYSADFIRRQSDLRSYAVGQDFLNLFPELKSEIPAFDPPAWNQNSLFITPASDFGLWRQADQSAPHASDNEDMSQCPAIAAGVVETFGPSDPGLSIFDPELRELLCQGFFSSLQFRPLC